MLTTDCERCCFLKQVVGKKACELGQVCSTKEGKVFAPGYCRLCRSSKWVKNQGTTELKELYKKILDECVLQFDMLVFFDEKHNTIEDLKRTLNSDWYVKYAKKIIIMDTTGFGNRKNLALQYLNGQQHSVPTIVDSSSEHESTCDCEKTLRRISKQITSPFFLAISAGCVMVSKYFDHFAKMVQHVPARVIHWSFSYQACATFMVPYLLSDGLFITKPYLQLIKSSNDKLFTELLREEEVDTMMGLSLLCANMGLV